MNPKETREITRKNTRQGVGCFAAFLIMSLIFKLLMGQVTFLGQGGVLVYEGPVMPLTVLSGDGLAAERQVDFDFAPYENAGGDFLDPNEVSLTDSYTLTNPTGETVRSELAYPYVGSLSMDARFVPAITVDGRAVEAKTLASVDARAAINGADDWEDFREAVTTTDFLAEAAADVPKLDQTVTVYEFTNLRGETGGEAYLAACFTMDPDETTVWTYGSISSVDNDETGQYARLLHIPNGENWVLDHGYLIVEGADWKNLTLQGYDSWELTEEHKFDGVSGDMVRYESTLGDVIAALAPDEAIRDGAAKRLADPDHHSAATANGSLSGLFDEVARETVMLYRVFPVELAPGGTVTIEAAYHQEASRSSSGFGEAAERFDLATRLGSSLDLREQSASLTNSRWIEIAQQNFGFDPERGVTAVILDPDTERYYMTVRPKA